MTDATYIATRNSLIKANEGFSTNVYLDTNGVPTVGTGVALLTSSGAINTDNMQNIANVLGANSQQYLDIQAFAQTVSDAIVGTPSMGVIHTASDFMATERGRAIVDAIGSDVKYVPGSSFMFTDDSKNFSVSADQANSINTDAINAREAQLDQLITNSGGDPAKITMIERCILMDVLYQYGSGSNKVIKAVDNLINGGNDLGLLKDVTNARYPERSKNDLALIKGKFAQSKKIVSPIVLDLNGDGIATTDLQYGAYFDHNANGFAENTGWVNAQDGMLVRDLDGNGTIDSGRELFGSETLLANGQKAANGYAALSELDTNQDGQINAQDASAATLKIWKDTNLDGYSSADELFTLADAGVQSIATGNTAANQVDANGNTIKQTGVFTRTDGSTGNSADIWFAVNSTNTIATEWLPETAAVAALPDLQGYGNVRDLHQAILRDNTGHLQDLVQQFVNATDVAIRHSLIDQLIYAWVGVENVDPASRGYIADARQLYVLEAFMGESYTQGYGYNAGTPNAGWNAGSYLNGVYKELAAGLYNQLMAQTHLKPLLDSIGVSWNAATNQFDWDITSTVALLQDRYTNGDPDNSIGEFAAALKLGGDSGTQVIDALRAQGDAANDEVFEIRRNA